MEDDRDSEREKKERATRDDVTLVAAAKEQRVDSLGWLTESSVMPKKQRTIEGVGASSIVELRAQLYRTQEDVKRAKETGVEFDSLRPRKKIDAFSKKNSGVEERASRDKLQLKAVKDGSESYAALEKKAELYDKLLRGEVSDEEEKEKYSVDFLKKGYLEDEFKEMERERRGEPVDNLRKDTETANPAGVDVEKQRLGVGWRPGTTTGLTQEQKQIIREVNEETIEAREKSSSLKQRRQMQAEKNREKLRLAFLKKQVEKLKSSAKGTPMQQPNS
ncbi:unnamed protein product [Sphagnum tenellum]